VTQRLLRRSLSSLTPADKYLRLSGFETRDRGLRKGCAPFVGSMRGAGPLCRSREASFRADPATERGSNPAARSKADVRRETLSVKR